MDLAASRRQRLNNPAIGPQWFTPDQAAWRVSAPRVAADHPERGTRAMTLSRHRVSDGMTLVSDTTAALDGWIPEPGTFGSLWRNGPLP